MAFKDCVKLGNFNLPSTLLEIGDEAFSNCQGITEVVIPKGVTKIGDEAFSNCQGITEVVIPKGVTKIGKIPFKDCKNIASIAVDADNTVYDSRSACNAIITTETNTLIVACKIQQFDGVERIASCAFYKIDINKSQFSKCQIY